MSAEALATICVEFDGELVEEVTREIVAQTTGPILLAKRFPVPGSDDVVALGGDAHESCARAIARNVLRHLVVLTERGRR